MTLAVVLSLSSCTSQPTTESPDISPDVQPTETSTYVSSADKFFTVRYDTDYSFNPITGTSPNNMALAPLMYEGLFVLDEKLAAQPVLCESYETTDGINYTFTLKPGIAMSDGSTLTATDVKYSLSMAQQTGRFSGRLNNLVSITTTDSLTLNITLGLANYKLPVLLDIPIIKAGSIDNSYPPGTGPYYFRAGDAPHLSAFSDYRDQSSIPISEIYLKACTDVELSIDFSSQYVDLFWDDPADSSDINILSDHEVRYYDTTVLQLIGFNANNRVLKHSSLRRAIGLAIDKKNIVDTIYANHAVTAALILSHNYSLYDATWENSSTDALTEISEIFYDLNMEDANSDGFLEFPDANGVNIPFTLKFIVNGDNKYKVAAAEDIATSLRSVGINVSLTKLTWEAYKTALESGSFDMYYGDVYLPANYDLTELLSPEGSIDYGNIGSSTYQSYINDFLSAKSTDAEKAAAKRLCAYVDVNAPIIPILFRQFTVHTNRNVVSGLNPTQSSIFFGFNDWSINLG